MATGGTVGQQTPHDTFVGSDGSRRNAVAICDMLVTTVLIPLPRPSILVMTRGILYRYAGSVTRSDASRRPRQCITQKVRNHNGAHTHTRTQCTHARSGARPHLVAPAGRLHKVRPVNEGRQLVLVPRQRKEIVLLRPGGGGFARG